MEHELHERTAGHFVKKPIPVFARPACPGETVKTREGELIAQAGDWIMTGIEGEHYPIGAAILAKTYTRSS